MNLRTKILCKIIISILFLSNSFKYAQHHEIQFETITIADGIGDAVGVLDILQDERGFIWIATIDGLTRYDGYNFKNFLHDPYDSTSISTNRVFALCEADGYLWIGSQYQGLDRYDPVSEEFKRYHDDPEDSTLVDINWIFDIVKGENCLWIGTLGEGLFKFDIPSETFTQYKHDPNDNSTISDNRINKLFVDRNGNLWIGLGGITGTVNSYAGLNRFDPKSKIQ